MLLDIQDLSISFNTFEGNVHVLDGISFSVNEGEVLSIVGESGSGKSVAAYSILGLLDNNSIIEGGSIKFCGTDLLKLSKKEIRKFRGKEIGMVFQEPMTALHPTMKIGNQLINVIKKNRNVSKKDAYTIMLDMLRDVHFDEPESLAKKYPYELSGGMRQRVVIALAMSSIPKLLIADEPTTALDVTIQKEILSLMKELVDKHNTSILLITHDLSIIKKFSNMVCVMYCGEIMEKGTVDDVLNRPRHPYTRALLQALPEMVGASGRLREIKGEVPDLKYRPAGCIFTSRCLKCTEICKSKKPPQINISDSHTIRCWEGNKLWSQS